MDHEQKSAATPVKLFHTEHFTEVNTEVMFGWQFLPQSFSFTGTT